jgi:hypothetical protein
MSNVPAEDEQARADTDRITRGQERSCTEEVQVPKTKGQAVRGQTDPRQRPKKELASELVL